MAGRNLMTPQDFNNSFSEIDLPLYGVRLPVFKIEDEAKEKAKLPNGTTNYDFLRALCLEGFNRLKLTKDSTEYKTYVERVKYELEIFKELGFVDYILMVWDVINFCGVNKIPTGFGRGSAAGSLVLFLIGVTKIDPIKHKLYFERFVSKIRAKKQIVNGVTYLDGSLLPDVDLDICYYRRGEVIKHLETKYQGHTSKILTLNTLSGKLLIKECGKVVSSKSEQQMNEISHLIPKFHGIVEDISDAYDEVPEFKKWCDENSRVYEIALKLRDLNKNKGVHPSGILISFDELEKACPTELSSDKESVSSYDMNWISAFNIKLDVLGLRGVSVVDDICKSIGISIDDIDLNDPFIYQNLQDLRTRHGLFQIEADLAYKVVQKVKPKNLEELSAVLALARPGAMAFTDQYALFTNHQTYQPIHPFFDDVLKETGGVALYQEQLMKMAHKIGFTLDEAEVLRRIVGKKKLEEVKTWKQKISDKVKENNLPKEVGEILWKILENSASYSFNLSHSCAYSTLSAITTYLKFKYPQQFYLSLLKMTKHEPDPIGEISKIHKEMSVFGIKLLPPHLLMSDMDFKIEGKNIRFGLLSVKGISSKSIEKLNKFKNEYSNKFEVFEAANEAGLNVGALSALIQAGAFDNLKQSRSYVVYEAQLWNLLTSKEKKYAIQLGKEHNFSLVKILNILKEIKDEKGKPIVKASRGDTIKRNSEPYKKIYEQNKSSEKFANWWYENKLLGYSCTVELIDIFREKMPSLIPIRQITEATTGLGVVFIGTVTEQPKTGKSKAKGAKYAKMNISDETGGITTLIFNHNLQECETLNDGLPQEGDIVIVKGSKKEDAVFASLIAVQQSKIFTKLSELKNSPS